MRVVLDVNVWISGWLWRGIPGEIIILAQNREITVFASAELLEELEATLRRDKLQSRIEFVGANVDNLMLKTRRLSQLCQTSFIEVPQQLRDPDDAMILATASAAGAEAIITGDLDLLTLNEFERIPILKPIDFLSRYFPIAP